jgi:hypothetical protein
MSEDFFNKYGLNIQEGQVEVGKVYPLYGIITSILDESFENFTVEVNSSIILRCNIDNEENVEVIKSRAFEPGIFVTEITGLEPVRGHCKTIVFGRKQETEMV